MDDLRKYPRTRHVEGSRLQPGDHDLNAVPWKKLAGKHLVVEEKLDGANAGLSFGPKGELKLQSRGHYLTGGAREKHFAMLKTWATTHRAPIFERLGTRYVLYGEWLYAKHTIFYDALPHWLMEFDVLDRETDEFLDTPGRRALLEGLPIHSVPVLHEGPLRTLKALTALVRPSLYKSESWKRVLRETAEREGLDPDRIGQETDASDASEGLYVKHEAQGRVVGRYKWVRASFLTSVVDSGSHWLDRPIVPNQLAPGAEPFGP